MIACHLFLPAALLHLNMQSRRHFIYRTMLLTAATATAAESVYARSIKLSQVGVQLYSFRKEMLADARGTLKRIAEMGYKHIESAKSAKGHYYGLTASEMKQTCVDLGLQLSSGHVQLDENWQRTMEEAAASGQKYLICSTMPTNGQNIDNYKRVAEHFNKAGEQCSKYNIRFGYHNHEYEFEAKDGQVLYDVLMDNTDAKLVHMELDLGWVAAAGKNPLDYFNKYPGRFPLWHLKDMDPVKKHSVEFGKGMLNIPAMLKSRKLSGLDIMFVEQEEYAVSAMQSLKEDIEYLRTMR